MLPSSWIAGLFLRINDVDISFFLDFGQSTVVHTSIWDLTWLTNDDTVTELPSYYFWCCSRRFFANRATHAIEQRLIAAR